LDVFVWISFCSSEIFSEAKKQVEVSDQVFKCSNICFHLLVAIDVQLTSFEMARFPFNLDKLVLMQTRKQLLRLTENAEPITLDQDLFWTLHCSCIKLAK